MPRLILDITTSLDGFVAGPNATLEQPLGEGGELLHDWITRLAAWRERHGLSGGETDADNELAEELLGSITAHVMGRRMFSGGAGPWDDDPKADGWWGDDPPFRRPVFVLTHHPRDRVVKPNGTSYTFVTEGVEAALEQAKAAAGDGDVGLSGGASVAQQYVRAGLVDAMHIHVVPVLLGGGTPLFGELGGEPIPLEQTRVLASPAVTHLSYARTA
jgi:dihydrofolate reductase